MEFLDSGLNCSSGLVSTKHPIIRHISRIVSAIKLKVRHPNFQFIKPHFKILQISLFVFRIEISNYHVSSGKILGMILLSCYLITVLTVTGNERSFDFKFLQT